MKLLLIRHGESVGNREARMAGHTADPLTATGHHQVSQLAQWLRQQNWCPTAIYSSPLRRAVETVAGLVTPWGWDAANVLAAMIDPAISPASLTLTAPSTRHVAVHFSPALMEFQAGIFTGLTWAEAQAHYPTLCHRLETEPDWLPIPHAETPQQGRDRAQQLIHDLLHRHEPDDALWIISHHWILEHLIAALMGCDRTWQLSIPNTALFEFSLDLTRWHQATMTRWTSDLWQVRRFGTCPHLSPMNPPVP